jgi:hypothetical protein
VLVPAVPGNTAVVVAWRYDKGGDADDVADDDGVAISLSFV